LIIGTLIVELNLPGVDSLKEKRRRIKSLIKRLQNKFNLSIAEVDYNDTHRMACLGAAVVSNDKKFIDQVIAKIVRMIENEPEMILTDYRVEIL